MSKEQINVTLWNGKTGFAELEWDSLTGVTSCALYDISNKKYFYGFAFCCEEDRDMQSEKTGKSIALSRAYLAYLKEEELKERYAIKGLKNYYKTSEILNKFQSSSVAIELSTYINMNEEKYRELKSLISKQYKILNDFISEKEDLYQKIRKSRKQHKDKTTE